MIVLTPTEVAAGRAWADRRDVANRALQAEGANDPAFKRWLKVFAKSRRRGEKKSAKTLAVHDAMMPSARKRA